MFPVGIIISEVELLSFVEQKGMDMLMRFQVSPLNSPSWMSKKDPKKKTKNGTHRGGKKKNNGVEKTQRPPVLPVLQAAVTSLIQLLDPTVGAAKVEQMGIWIFLEGGVAEWMMFADSANG